LTLYKGKLRTVSLQRIPSTHTVSKALTTLRKTAPFSLFSPKFLDTLYIESVPYIPVFYVDIINAIFYWYYIEWDSSFKYVVLCPHAFNVGKILTSIRYISLLYYW